MIRRLTSLPLAWFRKKPRNTACRRTFGRLEPLESRQLLSADIVTQWNDTTLDAIRSTNASPPVASRALAIVHTAIYGAVNAITHANQPYQLQHTAAPTASKEAAVSAAATRVLTNLFPTLATTFLAQNALILATIPDGLDENSGVRAGELAADAILALRASDGSTNAATPFVLGSTDQFNTMLGATQIPALDSADYAAVYNEVKELGSAASTTRSEDQTQIASFWADGAGTATPPGHLNRMAQAVSAARGATLEQNARLFALLNLALADTATAIGELKSDTDFWRPITAIRGGDSDGNDDTLSDSTWTPLITTPATPSYVSEQAAFSAASAAVLQRFFGTNNVGFTLESESASVSSRTFTTISQAADEAAASGLYAGVNWSFDNRDGQLLGDAIGDHVAASSLVANTAVTPVGVYDGVLVVVGSDRGEKISVFTKGTRIEVAINGKSKGRFESTTIQSISIDAKGGNDLVELVGRIFIPASIEGGNGDDRLYGGYGNDFISGGGGKDAIYGGRGNDRLDGGAGNDLIHGELGNDELFGGAGNDKLMGDEGADAIEGGLGNDTLYGGSGNDTLTGDEGNDQLYGESGRDLLFGGLGDDYLNGGGQGDTLDGGPGRNKLKR